MVLLGLLRQGSRVFNRLSKNVTTMGVLSPNGLGAVLPSTILSKAGPITGACSRFLTSMSPAWRSNDVTVAFGRFPILSSVTAQHWNSSPLLGSDKSSNPNFVTPHRHHIKFSLRKGKQKTVKAATYRFFMLRWGAFIRPKVGRHKKLWRKDWKRRQRLRRHVFCNSTQNQLLRHMMTAYWKRPKYYVDDPYEPYHVRNGIHRNTPKYSLNHHH